MGFVIVGRSGKKLIDNEFRKKIDSHLRRNLSRERYVHTLSVARLARALARKHGLPAEKAYLAGLLHDLAKEWSGKKLLVYFRRKMKYQNGSHYKFAPHLLHAPVSADLARRVWHVNDREILRAIAGHTLGFVKMAPLEKVLYVADLASTDRKFSMARRIRQMARRNINRAFRAALAEKFHHVIRSGMTLHPLSVRVWNEHAGN